jgi:predicted transcriptional regulator
MILREKKELTEMLILIEILHEKKKIKDIADTIGITIQGVSEYL